MAPLSAQEHLVSYDHAFRVILNPSMCNAHVLPAWFSRGVEARATSSFFASCVLSGLWSAGVQDASVNEQCGDILTSKRFMLDMLYAHNRKPVDDEEKGEGETRRTEEGAEAVATLASRISTLQANSLAQDESIKRVDVGCLDNRGSVKAFAEKFNSGDLGRGSPSPDTELHDKVAEKASAQPKTESDYIWDQLMANPRELRIQDMDFTDLGEEGKEQGRGGPIPTQMRLWETRPSSGPPLCLPSCWNPLWMADWLAC